MILAAEPVTLRRYAAPTRGSDGRAVVGTPTESTIQASVQPLSGREIALLPEGVRASDRRKAYTETEIRTADQHTGTLADEIVCGGVTYQVQAVAHQRTILPHYRAELARLRETP